MSIDILAGSRRLQLHYIMIIIYVKEQRRRLASTAKAFSGLGSGN